MNAVILHRRNSIQVFFADIDAIVNIAVPAEAMFDLDIKREDVYSQVIAKTIGSTSETSVRAILVLSDDICFVSQASKEDVEEKTKELLTNTPFSHVETVTISSDSHAYIIGVNADIYEAATRAFAVHGYQIDRIVPWGALVFYKLMNTDQMDRVAVKRIFDNVALLSSVSYPLASHEPSVSTTAPLAAKKKPVLSSGWIIFIVLAICYAVGMVWFMFRQ